MAEIDKSLPNTKTTVEIPGQTEIEQSFQEDLQELQNKDVEIIPTEDGGAEVSFDPSVASIAGGEDHYANLAEFLDESILVEIGSDILDQYIDYKASRQDWEMSYTSGLDLLGFKYERRTEPFRGSSGATHPVLAEAVTQFQSQAYRELLPSDGPVRTQIVGKVTREREDQANRVKD